MSVFHTVLQMCSDIVPLDEGGQKSVARASHQAYGPVVLKWGRYSSATTLERMAREVRLLKELDAHYFPKHFEFVVDPVAQEFLIVEEFLPCPQLASSAHQFRNERSAVALLRELVNALSHVWERRIVHRDLKPANILLCSDGTPRIIDFGIARFLDDQSLTKTLAAMGPATPIYAAPEQLLNRKDVIDIRTDMFALGIIVAELCFDYHPFDPRAVGNNISVPENIVAGKFVIPETASGPLTSLISRLLGHQPYQRFRNARVLTAFLDSHWS